MILLRILAYIVFGVVFTAFVALVFSLLTLLMGKISPHFEIAGPEGWTFREFYARYLIIAAVFTFVTLPLGPGLLGLAALAVAYKYVFDAGWLQAVVIGGMGGAIALVLFVFMLTLVLQPLGLMETPPAPGELDQQPFDELDQQSSLPVVHRPPRHMADASISPSLLPPDELPFGQRRHRQGFTIHSRFPHKRGLDRAKLRASSRASLEQRQS